MAEVPSSHTGGPRQPPVCGGHEGKPGSATTKPMTTRDIAVEQLMTQALGQLNQRLLRLMTKRVGVALHGQAGNGTVKYT